MKLLIWWLGLSLGVAFLLGTWGSVGVERAVWSAFLFMWIFLGLVLLVFNFAKLIPGLRGKVPPPPWGTPPGKPEGKQ